MDVNASQKKNKDEISLKELLKHFIGTIRFLFSKWKVIFICAVIGMLGGLTYVLLSPTQYVATIDFVTDTDQNSVGMSSYAGLAAAFGLNIDNGSIKNSLFSGDNIYDLMKTRRMLTNTLLTPVNIEGKRTLLIDRYIQMKNLKKRWASNPHLKNISFDRDSTEYTKYHNQIISSICKSLIKDNLQFPNESGSNNSSLMSVTLASPDEQFSALFITNLIENVGCYYISTTTKAARNTLNVLNLQLDSVRNQLFGAMANVASFTDKNLNLIRQAPRVQQQKGTLKIQVNSAIYQQLISAVETAKMSLQKETPLFEIVDQPVLPLDKRNPGLVLWAFIGLFIGTVLSCVCLLLPRLYESVMTDG